MTNSQPTFRFSDSAALVFIALAYALAVAWIYTSWVSPRYAYLGFPYRSSETFPFIASLMFAALPAIFLPPKFSRPSDFILWLLYFFVYIPSSIIPTLQGLLVNQFYLSVSLFLGFAAMRFAPRIDIIPSLTVKITPQAFWFVFAAIYFALNAYVYYTFRGVLSIATVETVYDQRFAGGDVQAGTVVGYASGFLSGAFNPFLIAVGLERRKTLLIAIGIAGQIFIYSTLAAKAIVAATLLVPLLYFFIIRSRRGSNPMVLGAYAIAVTVVPMLLYQIPAIANHSLMTEVLMPILYMRTMMMPGALTGIYAEFFSVNPVTNFSHIGLLSNFMDYPYGAPLGVIIGYSITGSSMNANANFFATDGIAALGIWGLPIIGAIAGTVFKIIDRLLDPRVYAVFCAASISVVFSLANSSLFATLLTGGLGGLALLLMLWGRVVHADSPQPAA